MLIKLADVRGRFGAMLYPQSTLGREARDGDGAFGGFGRFGRFGQDARLPLSLRAKAEAVLKQPRNRQSRASAPFNRSRWRQNDPSDAT